MGNSIKRTQATNKPKTAVKLLLALFLALTIVPVIPGAVSEAAAVDIANSSDLVSAANLGGTQVYFGDFNSSPILWHVVATDSGTATLWTTSSMGDRAYDQAGLHFNWSGSDICAWLNGTGSYTANGFFPNAFSAVEQNALSNYSNIPEQGLTGAPFTPNQKIVLPSVAEIGDAVTTGTWGIPYTGLSNDGKRGFGDDWWLRSPGDDTDYWPATGDNAACVSPIGSVSAGGLPAINIFALRPALKLDLSSVLFTSSANATSGKSSVSVADGLTSATTPAGAVKLTILDGDTTKVNLASATLDKSVVKAGDTLTVTFAGARTDIDKYVSALLVDDSGAPTHYVKLSQGENGMVSVTIPSETDLPSGVYYLSVFNEQVGADTATDYASSPIAITLIVDNTKPTVSSLAPSGTSENTDGTIAITFSDAMDIAAGTVTLDNGIGAITGGSWSSINVYEVPYSGLDYAREYTVTVEGFSDVAGNLMDTDATNTFTTMSVPVTPTKADYSKNTFTISGGTTHYTNAAIVITATGDRQDATGTLIGDTRYLPIKASANPTVAFTTTAPYTATMKIATAGSYTLSVTFEEQEWDGSTWVATGEVVVKSEALTITSSSGAASSIPNAGDDTPLGLTGIAMLASCLLAYAAYRKAKHAK